MSINLSSKSEIRSWSKEHKSTIHERERERRDEKEGEGQTQVNNNADKNKSPFTDITKVVGQE